MKLQGVLKTNLIRVPKKIKRTPIKEFVAEYGPLPDVASAPRDGDEENDGGLLQTAVKGDVHITNSLCLDSTQLPRF